jgi:hypothetical protein
VLKLLSLPPPKPRFRIPPSPTPAFSAAPSFFMLSFPLPPLLSLLVPSPFSSFISHTEREQFLLNHTHVIKASKVINTLADRHMCCAHDFILQLTHSSNTVTHINTQAHTYSNTLTTTYSNMDKNMHQGIKSSDTQHTCARGFLALTSIPGTKNDMLQRRTVIQSLYSLLKAEVPVTLTLPILTTTTSSVLTSVRISLTLLGFVDYDTLSALEV